MGGPRGSFGGQGGPGLDRRGPGGDRGSPREVLEGSWGALSHFPFFGGKCASAIYVFSFVWFCEAAADLDRTGPDRTGPDWTGLDRTGPDWTGLNKTGLRLGA